METATPEHDELCEWKGFLVEEEHQCHCAERRDAAGIDPTLLKLRVKRVRQATVALEKVRHTLATYVSEHAPTHCEHTLPPRGPEIGYYSSPRPCPLAVDGFILLSCGHHAFLCAHHGSVTLRAVQGGAIDCTKTEPDLHSTPARGVTIEWMSLA